MTNTVLQYLAAINCQAWAEHLEERAAIREYDGEMKREDAEAEALGDLVRWVKVTYAIETSLAELGRALREAENGEGQGKGRQ